MINQSDTIVDGEEYKPEGTSSNGNDKGLSWFARMPNFVKYPVVVATALGVAYMASSIPSLFKKKDSNNLKPNNMIEHKLDYDPGAMQLQELIKRIKDIKDTADCRSDPVEGADKLGYACDENGVYKAAGLTASGVAETSDDFCFYSVMFPWNNSRDIVIGKNGLDQLTDYFVGSGFKDRVYKTAGAASIEGTDDYNKRLSEKRGDGIKNKLDGKGLAVNENIAVGETEEFSSSDKLYDKLGPGTANWNRRGILFTGAESLEDVLSDIKNSGVDVPVPGKTYGNCGIDIDDTTYKPIKSKKRSGKPKPGPEEGGPPEPPTPPPPPPPPEPPTPPPPPEPPEDTRYRMDFPSFYKAGEAEKQAKTEPVKEPVVNDYKKYIRIDDESVIEETKVPKVMIIFNENYAPDDNIKIDVFNDNTKEIVEKDVELHKIGSEDLGGGLRRNIYEGDNALKDYENFDSDGNKIDYKGEVKANFEYRDDRQGMLEEKVGLGGAIARFFVSNAYADGFGGYIPFADVLKFEVDVKELFGIECRDGWDNDHDGLVDKDDPGCVNNGVYDSNDNSEISECADGIDNDGDGLIDKDDPGCVNNGVYAPNDNDEFPDNDVVVAPPPKKPKCSDGVDNDDDKLIDKDDPGCVKNDVYDPDDDNEKDKVILDRLTGSAEFITGSTEMKNTSVTGDEIKWDGDVTGYAGKIGINISDNISLRASIRALDIKTGLETLVSDGSYDKKVVGYGPGFGFKIGKNMVSADVLMKESDAEQCYDYPDVCAKQKSRGNLYEALFMNRGLLDGDVYGLGLKASLLYDNQKIKQEVFVNGVVQPGAGEDAREVYSVFKGGPTFDVNSGKWVIETDVYFGQREKTDFEAERSLREMFVGGNFRIGDNTYFLGSLDVPLSDEDGMQTTKWSIGIGQDSLRMGNFLKNIKLPGWGLSLWSIDQELLNDTEMFKRADMGVGFVITWNDYYDMLVSSPLLSPFIEIR